MRSVPTASAGTQDPKKSFCNRQHQQPLWQPSFNPPFRSPAPSSVPPPLPSYVQPSKFGKVVDQHARISLALKRQRRLPQSSNSNEGRPLAGTLHSKTAPASGFGSSRRMEVTYRVSSSGPPKMGHVVHWALHSTFPITCGVGRCGAGPVRGSHCVPLGLVRAYTRHSTHFGTQTAVSNTTLRQGHTCAKVVSSVGPDSAI